MLELPAEPVTKVRRSRGACLAIKPVVTGALSERCCYLGEYTGVTMAR
jgi:hypothetical protein